MEASQLQEIPECPSVIPLYLVADDEIVKVHVHTNHPGQAFENALTYGALSRMKIDNMREEHQEKLIKDAQKLAREQEEAGAAKMTLRKLQSARK